MFKLLYAGVNIVSVFTFLVNLNVYMWVQIRPCVLILFLPCDNSDNWEFWCSSANNIASSLLSITNDDYEI